MRAGMRAISSGVRPTVSGSSAGSPSGSEPSGSSLAARCPCMRCALSSDVAACTACIIASSATAVGRRGRRGERRAGRGRRRGRRRGPGRPARPERRAEVGEELLVEAVLALQVALDGLQELARLGALDDAMVIRRRHRHDLLGADRGADRAAGPADSRSRRWRRSCPGPASAAARTRSSRCRPGW